jgi:hypothetical protein
MPRGGKRLGAGRPKGSRKAREDATVPVADVPRPELDDAGQVEAMAGYGVPERAIAQVLRIGVDELRQHYQAELDRGLAVATVAVAQNLYAMAIGKDRTALTAAIFWLRSLAGWLELSPRRADTLDPPVGKKEAAQISGETAPDDMGWRGLVN